MKESTPTPGQNIESKDWQKFIPLSKSWVIRMGFLDMINGYKDIEKFLETAKDLGEDLVALKRIIPLWDTEQPLDVGESGTLYRYLKFASNKLGLNKKFITHATLTNRLESGRMTENPDVNLSLKELLNLPEKTTQYASAAILLGNREEIPDEYKDDFHIKMSQEAAPYWEAQRKAGKAWEARGDETIQAQAEAFLEMLNGKRPKFIDRQGEDYAFARVFDYMTREEGEKKYPKIQGHETPRLDETDRVIKLAEKGEPIDSPDHRVVQAIAMWGKVNKKELVFTPVARKAVNKTWPLFWEFLDSVTKKN